MNGRLENIISPTEDLHFDEEGDRVFRAMTFGCDELLQDFQEKGTPFTIERFLEHPEVAAVMKEDTLRVAEENLQRVLLAGSGITDAFVQYLLRPWSAQCKRFRDAEFEMFYQVRALCNKDKRNPRRIMNEVRINRKRFEKYLQSDFQLTQEYNPLCDYCTSRGGDSVHHEPEVSFMKYVYPWENEFRNLWKQMNKLDKRLRHTPTRHAVDRNRIISQMSDINQEMDRYTEEVRAFMYTTRIKGFESIYNKMARVITRLDERVDTGKTRNTRNTIKDWYGVLAIPSSEENLESLCEHLRSQLTEGHIDSIEDYKDHFHKRTVDDGVVLVPGPKYGEKGETRYKGVKMAITYCGLPLEMQIMLPDAYDIYSRDHSGFKERMRRYEIDLTHQGIPFDDIRQVVENILTGKPVTNKLDLSGRTVPSGYSYAE